MKEPPRPNKRIPSTDPRLAESSIDDPQPTESTRQDPLIGRTVSDKFTITALIARGGMGKVYKAVQAPLGRLCALKVLSPKYDQEDDPEFQRRFFREASTAANLNHANTITVYDYGQDGDIYYIAMEYVRGRTLYQILREDGPMDEVSVSHIMREVGRSLREAHALGVIHRDMKPANVVVTTQGEELALKVLDFGLVKKFTPEDTEDLTQEGLFMGSPKYMAPEQILGHAVSPRTDIYALGVVAYEMLTGEPPFERGNSVKTLMAHVNEPPPPMRRILPELRAGEACIDVVMRCLAKDPDDRFEDIDHMLEALVGIDGIAPSRYPPSVSEPVMRPPFSSSEFPLLDDPPSSDTLPDQLLESAAPTTRDHHIPAALDFPGPPSSGKPFIPSATPAPMAQSAVLEPLGAGFRLPKRRVGIAAAALFLMALGVSVTHEAELAGRAEPRLARVIPVAGLDAGVVAIGQGIDVGGVVVSSEPAGASVHEGETQRCEATPCTIRRSVRDAEPLVLTLRKAGHRPRSVEVQRRSLRIDVKLDRARTSKKLRPRRSPGTPRPKKLKTPSGYKASPY